MPPLQTAVLAGGSPAGSDICLKVVSARAGHVKGEVAVDAHRDEIQVQSWSWSLTAHATAGGAQQTGRRQYSPLRIVKGIDRSTTGLMSCLATNDSLKEVVLTMRKAGGDALDYFKVKLGGARVASLEHQVAADGSTVEVVQIGFVKVEVEYSLQETAGGRAVSFTFADEILAHR